MDSQPPAPAVSIQVRFALLPEDRVVIKSHLLEQARNGALPEPVRRVALVTAQALAVSSSGVSLRWSAPDLRLLLAALDVPSGPSLSPSTANRLTRAREAMTNSIRHELARRGVHD